MFLVTQGLSQISDYKVYRLCFPVRPRNTVSRPKKTISDISLYRKTFNMCRGFPEKYMGKLTLFKKSLKIALGLSGQPGLLEAGESIQGCMQWALRQNNPCAWWGGRKEPWKHQAARGEGGRPLALVFYTSNTPREEVCHFWQGTPCGKFVSAKMLELKL